MHPAFRLVLAIVGAVLGGVLASDGVHLMAGIVGALAGLAVGEALALRAALTALGNDVQELRAALRPHREPQPERPAVTERPQPSSTPGATPAPAQTAPARPVIAAATAEQAAAAWLPPAVSPADHTDTSSASWTAPLIRLLREYFTGGNTLVSTGVVVLIFGVAFLLHYLVEHSHIPIELRLAAVALGGLALLVLGWRLRARRPGYALALQGGAIGVLYLTVFSGLRLYSVLNSSTAFVLLAVISALAAALAVLQSSLAVALLAVTGGFLAPFLASSGTGSHVALFSYFLVLNGVILGIAWFRSWRLLNVVGFLFTFVLSTVWGVLQYQPQDFASTEPFLIAFFVIYVLIAVLYSTRQAPAPHRYIDATILFGTPITAFGLQAAMLHERWMALAYSALCVGALYVCLGWLLYRRRSPLQRPLVEAFAALSVAFLTLAIPLALSGQWSAVSWALEGAALIWVGCQQNRRLPRTFGALLQIAAGVALALASMDAPGAYVAALMVGLAAAYSAQYLHTRRAQLADYERDFLSVLFLWGLLWWCAGGVGEIRQHVGAAHLLASILVFATATALTCSELARRRAQMLAALLPALALLPVMLLFALRAAAFLPHPLAQGGWIGWPMAFLGFYLILRRHDAALGANLTGSLHALTLWLLTALLSWEIAWAIAQGVGHSGAWSAIAWAIVPVAVLTWLPHATTRVAWPFRAHRDAYEVLASAGLALYLCVWSLATNVTVSSPAAPLPYLPLLNPLDIAQGFVIFTLVRVWVRLRSQSASLASRFDARPALGALALVGFVWLNAVLLRTLNQWAEIPYELKAMADSTLAQSALSIFWAFLALTTMLIATRIGIRTMWLTGVGLLVIVVLKLFLVDLSSIGTIERIVSFVGVGLLMLIIGYFSPLPPAAKEEQQAS